MSISNCIVPQVNMATNKFIQIFLVNRFCQLYKEDVNSLLTLLPKEHKLSAQNLISLLDDLGIVEYMNQLSDDKDDFETAVSTLIDNMTTKYPDTFHNLIYSSSYSSKQNHPFQQSILYQPDMFISILQYLDLESLNSCSLVNSHWLINVFNPNCVQFLDFNDIAVKGSGTTKIDNDNHKRVGQRFCNAKYICINDWNDQIDFGVASKILCHCNSSMVEKLEMSVRNYQDKDSFKCIKLLQKFGPKLQLFQFMTDESPIFSIDDKGYTYQRTLFYDSIHLMNCERIDISGGLFPIIITKKCKKLSLGYECFLDYTSKYFDVSGVTLLRLSSTFPFDANIIHDNYKFLKNYEYIAFESINKKRIAIDITDQHLVALAKQFCSGIGILTLIIDNLGSEIAIDEKNWRIFRLWQILNDNNQRPIFTSLKLINGEYDSRQINQIMVRKLAASELIIEKAKFCDSDKTDVPCLVKFIDYILNINYNNTIKIHHNCNKFEFLRVGWAFEEELLQGIVDKFIQLKNKNKQQFETVAKQLKLIQMPYNSHGSNASSSFGISTLTVVSILELIEEINRVKTNYNSKHDDQLKPSMCQFMGDFRISDHDNQLQSIDKGDIDWMQMVSKKIKNLMKQQIPMHIKIWVPNGTVTPLELVESPFTINLDNSGMSTSKWYKEPICNEKYGIPRCYPYVSFKCDEYSIEISNVEHSGHNGIKFE